jgi:amino acid transporter
MQAQGTTRLKANAIGLIGLAVLGAVMMSPALGIYGNWGPMASLVGLPTPLVFLAALVISIPAAVSYAVVSRELPSTGSVFTYVWESMSPAVGTWIGLMMTIYYTVAVTLQPIFFGLFFNDLLNFLGFHHTTNVTWGLGVALATVLVVFITYRGINLSTRYSVLFISIEVAVVVALSLTIIVDKIINGGFTLAPFNPGRIQGGFSVFWTAIILGILSYTGFDVITTVAEEAKAPRRLLPKAVLLSCVGVGIFWALNSWAFSISVPVSEVQKLTASGLTAATPIADKYWGAGRILVILTALSAATAVYIVTVVGSSRSLFAMAREKVLPAPLAKLHPTFQAPWTAMTLVYILSLGGIVITTAALGNALDSFVWWAGVIVFFALIVYVAVNLANIVYFTRFAKDKFNWFLNGLIPAIGIGIDGYLIYRSFFKALWSAGFRTGRSVVLFSLALVVFSIAWVLYVKLAHPDRLTGSAMRHVEVEAEPGIHS